MSIPRLYENELEKRELNKSKSILNTKTMKTRKKGEAAKEHKVVRNFVKGCEITAKQKVLDKTKLQPKAFKTAHTEKCFVFVEK